MILTIIPLHKFFHELASILDCFPKLGLGLYCYSYLMTHKTNFRISKLEITILFFFVGNFFEQL